MSRFAKGGIIGVIIGAVAGVLFAPKSGKETRSEIKEGADKFYSKSEKELKSLFTELDDQRKLVTKKANNLSGASKKEMSALAASAKPLQEQVKDTISNIREGLNLNQSKVEKTIQSAKDKIEDLKSKSNDKS